MIERIRQRTDESDRAVSPVIGIILMVAITVILAAVVGSFVLGIGGDINETPQVRLGVSDAPGPVNATEDETNDLFVIEHSGGDTIEAANLNLIVNNVSDGDAKLDVDSIGSDLSTGDRETISESDDTVVDGPAELRVRIVHEPSDNLLLDTTIEVE